MCTRKTIGQESFFSFTACDITRLLGFSLFDLDCLFSDMKPLLFRLLFPKLEISYAVVCVDTKFGFGSSPLFYLRNHLFSKGFLFLMNNSVKYMSLGFCHFGKLMIVTYPLRMFSLRKYARVLTPSF